MAQQAYAIRTDAGPIELPYGEPVLAGEDRTIGFSYETMLAMADDDLDLLGVGAITEPDDPPAGKIVTGSTLGQHNDGTIFRMWTLVDPPPPPVPTSASKLGLKRALAEQGKWTMVRTAIAADADRQEDWDLAIEIRRTDPLVATMIALLDMSTADVDALLVRAAELVA